jgi:hypothetical protein
MANIKVILGILTSKDPRPQLPNTPVIIEGKRVMFSQSLISNCRNSTWRDRFHVSFKRIIDKINETPERICLFFKNFNVFFSLKSELNKIGIKVTT